MARSTSSALALVVAIALAATTIARGDEWESTRETVIDPINSELHRHLPSPVKARELEEILALHATDSGTGLLWVGGVRTYPRQDASSRWALFHPDFPAPISRPYRLLGLFTSEVKRRSDTIVDELTRGSTPLHNDGDGTFTDVAYVDGADRQEDGRGLTISGRVREVSIWWPSGAPTRITDLEGGHRFTITENSPSPISCANPACPH